MVTCAGVSVLPVVLRFVSVDCSSWQRWEWGGKGARERVREKMAYSQTFPLYNSNDL